MNKLDVRVVTYADTKPFLLNKHYAHRMPSISYAYGLYVNDELHGVITYGTPASHSLVIGVAGKENASNVIELNRLYIDDGYSLKDVASSFVSATLKLLKPLNKIVVSYADTGMNHVGYIYQATNFYYTGKTPSRTDKYVGHNKHSRHYVGQESTKYRAVRSSKYRYIYLACDRRHKRQFLHDLRYPILDEYPKGNQPMEHYQVGETKPEILKEIATGNIITKTDKV